MRKKKQDKQVCDRTNNNVYTNKNEFTIELSRKREHERSTLRTFVRLFVFDYKRDDTNTSNMFPPQA